MGNSTSHFSNVIDYDAADTDTQDAFFRQLMDDVECAVVKNPHVLRFSAYKQSIFDLPRIAVEIKDGRHVLGPIQSVYDVLEEMGCTVHTTDYLEDPFLYPLPHAEYRHAGEYIVRIPASEIDCYPPADTVLIPIGDATEMAIAAEVDAALADAEAALVDVEAALADVDAEADAETEAMPAVAEEATEEAKKELLDVQDTNEVLIAPATAPLAAEVATAPLEIEAVVAPLEIEAPPKKRRSNAKRTKTAGSV